MLTAVEKFTTKLLIFRVISNNTTTFDHSTRTCSSNPNNEEISNEVNYLDNGYQYDVANLLSST